MADAKVKISELPTGVPVNTDYIPFVSGGVTKKGLKSDLKGDTGDNATATVGTTTTGSPGTNASVTNVGTTSDAIFDFIIPRGDVGATGPTGPTGPQGPAGSGTGDVVGPASSTDNAIARYDSTTGKLLQNSGVLIDDNNNVYTNNYFANITSTVSAGGTTVLTLASSKTQRLTGSSSQTYQLPNATTLPASSIFEFDNNSSSSLVITNAGAVTQYTVPAGGDVVVKCTDNTTSNGVWDFHAMSPSSVTWSSGSSGLVMNSVLSTTPSIGSGASSSTDPSFIPQRGASTTGFGGDGTNLYAIIAGIGRLIVSSTGIGIRNVANTFTGSFTNTITADRTYTLQNRNGTLADDTDLALKAPLASPTFTGTVVLPNSQALVTPVLGTPTSGILTNCTADGTNGVGFKNIPQNSKSAAYTTVLGDAGYHIYHPSADTTARIWTIDSNTNVAYPIGTAITFVNDTSGGVITIAITTDTLVLAGAGTTGSRTLAANGIATAIKMTSTRWMISGTGLT